jgi:hypothetical protein
VVVKSSQMFLDKEGAHGGEELKDNSLREG